MSSPSQPGNAPPSNGAAHHETVLEVNTQRIARVYAEALFRAAEQHGQADEMAAELQALIDDVIKRDPFFEEFLASGAVDRKRKAELIRSIFTGRASDLFINFLSVLNDHERLHILRPIVAAYRELLDEKAGRMPVQVRSAVALADDQRERLREQLRAAFHKEPVFETEIDPDLLGGVVVRVGDWLYDLSVRAELESIRDQIIARSSYEIQSGRNRFSVVGGN
jgi:F-type H+-transporting ATPase subunit delta